MTIGRRSADDLWVTSSWNTPGESVAYGNENEGIIPLEWGGSEAAFLWIVTQPSPRLKSPPTHISNKTKAD